MNHQPFENWIFEDTLSTQEKKELNVHLRDCKSCRELEESLQSFEAQIKAVPDRAPAPGFSQRWLASVEKRRADEQMRQAKKFILILVAAALASLILFLISSSLDQSPISWFVNSLSTIAQCSIRLRKINWLILSLTGKVMPTVQATLWIVLTVPFAILSMVWAGTIWRISMQGVNKQ